MESARVHGVVRCPEHATRTCVDVIHGHVDAAMLEVKVGIDIHNGIVAYLHSLVVGILNGKLLNGRRIVGRIITSKIAQIASQLHVQHLRNAELEIEIAVKRDFGQRQG